MNAEEIKVNEAVFSLLGRKPLADDMGNSRDAKPVLNGGSHGHSARPFADKGLAQHVTLGRCENGFGVVDCYIDKERVELAHFLYVGHQFRCALAFDRWEDLNRETSLFTAPENFSDRRHCDKLEFSSFANKNLSTCKDREKEGEGK